MGMAAEIAKRMLKSLTKGASEVADTGLSRVLKSQVDDITKAAGNKMSPEQSIKAMDTILELAPTPFSRTVRQDLIEELKSSGILEHPSSERVYAVGSGVTGKEVPSDLDILVRSTPRVTSDYRKLVGDIPDDEEMLSRGVHSIWPHGSASSGLGNMSNLRQKDLVAEVGDKAYSVATTGQGKYGKGHRWIRLLGATPAIPGGGWPQYREQK